MVDDTSAPERRLVAVPERPPLHFICMIDGSASMKAARIQSVNYALRTLSSELPRVAARHDDVQVFVRVMAFSTGARWLIAQPTPPDKLEYQLTEMYMGRSHLGAALRLAAFQLESPPMPKMAAPPLLLLLSDGRVDDRPADELAHLLELPWGKRSVRAVVQIGDDCNLDELRRFAGADERVLPQSAPEIVTQLIDWEVVNVSVD